MMIVKNTALYNTASYLWRNYPSGTVVAVHDGMIHKISDGWIARFEDDADAARTLNEEGWTTYDGITWMKE